MRKVPIQPEFFCKDPTRQAELTKTYFLGSSDAFFEFEDHLGFYKNLLYGLALSFGLLALGANSALFALIAACFLGAGICMSCLMPIINVRGTLYESAYWLHDEKEQRLFCEKHEISYPADE